MLSGIFQAFQIAGKAQSMVEWSFVGRKNGQAGRIDRPAIVYKFVLSRL